MRWQQLLELARDDRDAQQRVLDTALAALRQIDDPRLHACVVAAVPAARSLCELLDAFGVTVSDELAQELDRVAAGAESAWLSALRTRGVAPEPIGAAARLGVSAG